MGDSSYWDAAIRRLKDIEKKWLERPAYGGSIQTSTSRPMFGSGITTSSSGWGSGIWRAAEETALHAKFRVVHVTDAINSSFPAAFAEIETRLGGIKIDTIKDVLRSMLKDVALILGGSTVLGSGVGAAVGSLAFGVGAVPGAAIGATAGFEMGNLILTFTGLKSIATFMAGAVPAAIRCYGDGFREAWGEPDGKATWAHIAYKDFAKGHVLFVMAILMGIVGYLTRGKGNFPILMGEIRASAKLGPKFADWIELNQGSLMRNPALQQGMRMSAGAASDEAPAVAPQIQGPIRGQQLPNAIDPDAPISAAPATPAETLAKVNKGRAPFSELNAAVAEAQGYKYATETLGQDAISGPGKASVQGPDFLTLGKTRDGLPAINVWDAKYRGPNNPYYPNSIPQNQLDSWLPDITDAVNNMAPGEAKDAALDALQNGRIQGQIFKWPPQ